MRKQLARDTENAHQNLHALQSLLVQDDHSLWLVSGSALIYIHTIFNVYLFENRKCSFKWTDASFTSKCQSSRCMLMVGCAVPIYSHTILNVYLFLKIENVTSKCKSLSRWYVWICCPSTHTERDEGVIPKAENAHQNEHTSQANMFSCFADAWLSSLLF